MASIFRRMFSTGTANPLKQNPELVPLIVPVAFICGGATWMCWRTLFNAGDIRLTADKPRYESEHKQVKLIKEPLNLMTHDPKVGWFGVYPKNRDV